MPQFNEIEEAALWESPEALQVLIDWHETQIVLGEGQGYPMGFNKNRARELKERRLKLLHPEPMDEEEEVPRAKYD